MTGGIDLYSPSSYADGHPVAQYAWPGKSQMKRMTTNGVATIRASVSWSAKPIIPWRIRRS